MESGLAHQAETCSGRVRLHLAPFRALPRLFPIGSGAVALVAGRFCGVGTRNGVWVELDEGVPGIIEEHEGRHFAPP